ncbi:nuclear RNA export factor 2 [Tribolium castaneum]|uniref:Nuclear RNA export factor 2-like Protein n=1 Tax=Tribolium castaneum TaxID=7070 RepID=D1ZZZ2_TRICA|nr:PREDICTED: nuclear RNA export factor 2 isoform X2 [Tribolium castaneum]EFA01773.2 Nuclear RNA export factor 2-like Protein [Tribolium castaneum]|eukprot:XP_008192188.1 PREDICTED: nuclear RNA export factor 2 isoform X2 [Tribolium castaneum]
MDFKTVIPSPDAITLNEINVCLISQFKAVLGVKTYWHKFFIIETFGLTRNVVLKTLLEHVKPLEFIPLFYTQEGKGAYFFARICGPVIEKFCRDKLTVPNPFGSRKPFKLKIVLKYTTTYQVTVDLYCRNVLQVLQKRLKSRVLCLNNFVDDPDLNDFLLLSEPKLLAFVLNLAKVLKPTAIKLCNNEIKSLDALKVLRPRSINSLDLRNNLIVDLAELKHLSNFDITELWLEGNPLCDLYDEHSYVEQMVKYCPKIEKLDGFLLRQNGVPSFRRNFLCDVSASDVIDQFMRDYFTTYDSKNLDKLESLYHNDAVFSLTAYHVNNQVSSANSCIKSYKQYSRNLVDTPNRDENLYTGSREIMKLFDLLPHCEHDPYSFTVDVMHYSEKRVIVVVTGVFMEIPNVKRILGFNRSFFLEFRDSSLRIANEQLHVFNALTSQQAKAFKKQGVLQEVRNVTEKNQMLNIFVIITNLTKEWAKLFLEECQYNLKHALLVFVDLYKRDKIPSHGFKPCD